MGRDRQPQAGAAVLSRRRGIDLRKRLEQPVLFFRSDADAGVGHGEVQRHVVIRSRLDLDMHDHLASFGELDRVASQVDHDLPQSSGIANQTDRNVGSDMTDQL